MTNGEKKEYLLRYGVAQQRIRNLREQLRSIREIEESAKIQQLSDMPKGIGKKKDLSDLVVRIEKLQQKIEDAITESLQIRTEIEENILRIADGDEFAILRMRYIELLKWEKIAVRMKYSWRQVIYTWKSIK